MCSKRQYKIDGKQHINRSCVWEERYEELILCPIKVSDNSEYLHESIGSNGSITDYQECNCLQNLCNGDPKLEMKKRDVLWRSSETRLGGPEMFVALPVITLTVFSLSFSINF